MLPIPVSSDSNIMPLDRLAGVCTPAAESPCAVTRAAPAHVRLRELFPDNTSHPLDYPRRDQAQGIAPWPRVLTPRQRRRYFPL